MKTIRLFCFRLDFHFQIRKSKILTFDIPDGAFDVAFIDRESHLAWYDEEELAKAVNGIPQTDFVRYYMSGITPTDIPIGEYQYKKALQISTRSEMWKDKKGRVLKVELIK